MSRRVPLLMTAYGDQLVCACLLCQQECGQGQAWPRCCSRAGLLLVTTVPSAGCLRLTAQHVLTAAMAEIERGRPSQQSTPQTCQMCCDPSTVFLALLIAAAGRCSTSLTRAKTC